MNMTTINEVTTLEINDEVAVVSLNSPPVNTQEGFQNYKELNLQTPSTITTNLLEDTKACSKATLYSSE